MSTNESSNIPPGGTGPEAIITPAVYSSGEVLDQFAALLADTSFSRQLRYLGMKRFSMSPRRRRAKRELEALYIGLWKLALDSSFPQQAEEFLTDFLNRQQQIRHGKKGERFCERVREYTRLLKEHEDKDFTAVAGTIIANIGLPEADCPKAVLALALDIRAFYQTIFDRLI